MQQTPNYSTPESAFLADPSQSAGRSAALLGIAGRENRMAVYKAAKAVKRSPAVVMSFVNQGLIKAWRRGGSAERPWLEIDLSELLAVMDRETLYVPPAMKGRKLQRVKASKQELHPLAAAI